MSLDKQAVETAVAMIRRDLEADADRVERLAHAMWKSVPDGTPQGVVTSAVSMLLYNLVRHDPEIAAEVAHGLACVVAYLVESDQPDGELS